MARRHRSSNFRRCERVALRGIAERGAVTPTYRKAPTMTTTTDRPDLTPYPPDHPRRVRPASPTLPPITYCQDDGRWSDGRGIALYIIGRAQRWEPASWWCEDPDDPEGGWWEPDPYGEGEWIDDPEGAVYVAMVGDGAPFEIDPAELRPLADEDYCSGCGQIGCGWC